MSSNFGISDVSVTTNSTDNGSTHSLDSLPIDEFLKIVGLRVRAQRSTLSMSRKRLAEVSGVSERYLAQLESGHGNMSIALLRKVTSAIGMSLGSLLSAEVPEFVGNSESSEPHASSNGQNVATGQVNSQQTQNEVTTLSPCAQNNSHRRVPELQ